MPFLRFETRGDDKLEWGFTVPPGFIPCIGDHVSLWHALPDEEADDCVKGVIVKRHWGFASDFHEYECIDFEVELSSKIPVGRVADSTEWPSALWSRRQDMIQVQIDRILHGLPA